MAIFVGNQGRLVLTGTFGAWATRAREMQLKWQHSRKAMMMLSENQTRLVMAVSLAAWVQLCLMARKERSAQKTDQDIARLRERHEESRRKFILAMTEGQEAHAQEMLKSTFVVWSRLLAVLRRERQNERRTIAPLLATRAAWCSQGNSVPGPREQERCNWSGGTRGRR